MYKLTITKTVENPNYEKEYKEYNRINNSRYNGLSDAPPVRFYPEKSMEVEITDEEFKKLKAETIKIFN